MCCLIIRFVCLFNCRSFGCTTSAHVDYLILEDNNRNGCLCISTCTSDRNVSCVSKTAPKLLILWYFPLHLPSFLPDWMNRIWWSNKQKGSNLMTWTLNGVACLRCCICTLAQLKHLYCLFPPGAFCAFLLLFSRIRFSLNLAIGDDTKIVYLNYKIK